MKMYVLKSSIQLPVPVEEAWNFLSNPQQLENITGNNLSLQPVRPLPDEMYEGIILEYQIKPILNLRINWVTEITHIEEKKRFIDVQRFGPFHYWHHEHALIENEHGTEMKDILHYVMPFSILGRFAHKLFVRRMLEDIFAYRQQKIGDYFK